MKRHRLSHENDSSIILTQKLTELKKVKISKSNYYYILKLLNKSNKSKISIELYDKVSNIPSSLITV